MHRCEFNFAKHYYDYWCLPLPISEYPIFKWLDKKVGPYNHHKPEGDNIQGDGWYFDTSPIYDSILGIEKGISGYIVFTKPIDDKLLVEFILRWS